MNADHRQLNEFVSDSGSGPRTRGAVWPSLNVQWQRITAIVVVGALISALAAHWGYWSNIPMQAQATCIPSRHVVSGEGGGGGSNTGNPPVCPDDLGDAPASYGVLRANVGAFHVQDPLKPLRLGLTVDTEPDGQPSTLAWGDLDPDEDGLLSATLRLGNNNSSLVLRSSGSGLLQGFIDFNGDGSWQITEQVALDHPLAGGQPQVVPVTVPPTAALGVTYMRLRFSDVSGLFAGGGAPNGEVEDYAVRVCPPWEDCCRRVAFVVDVSESMNTGNSHLLAETAVLQALSALKIPPAQRQPS